MAKIVILYTQMKMLVTFAILNGYTAQADNARDTRYDVVSEHDFQSILAWSCRAVTAAQTGPWECLKECVDVDGTRCYGYAYDNETCWICDEGDQYTISPSDVATMAHTSWISDSKCIKHSYKKVTVVIE